MDLKPEFSLISLMDDAMSVPQVSGNSVSGSGNRYFPY